MLLPFLALLLPYASTPGAVTSAAFRVEVDGAPVLVEHFKDVDYARFAFTGTARIQIEAASHPASLTVSPLAYGLRAQAAGDAFRLAIDQPRQLVVQLPGRSEKLFLFAEPPETDAPTPGTPGVTRWDGKDLQGALDRVGAQGGGVLLVPDGIYHTGTFSLRSGVTLYLSSGALIQGSERPADYDHALVLMTGLHDAWIAGRGTLASAGTAIKRVTAQKPRILEMADCVNCGLRDVVVRDSAGFTVHMLHCRNLRMSGYKIINDLNLPNQDGTDPDGCDGVTVSHVFMYTSDDAIAVKADHGHCQHLLIEDCVFWTKKSALKIGSDPYYGASDVTFRNDHVVHADRALALYSGKGPIEHVAFDYDTSETVGGDAKRMLIIFEVSKAKEHERSAERRGVGFIRDVVVDHYTAYRQSENPSLIAGVVADDGSVHRVEDVHFKHLVVAGKECAAAADANIVIGGKAGARTVSNVRFEP